MSWCTIESDPEARSSQRVRVVVIIRPLIATELGCTDCISVVHGEPQVQVGSQNFTFDYVYGGSTGSPSSALYDDCVSPLVDALFHGRNATVLAYGQTGSGKTYTMGTNYSGKGSNVGVISKVMEDIFQRVEVMKDSKEFVIRVSFIEVFKEEVYDLLVPNLRKGAAPLKRARDSIQIRDTGGGGTTLVGVTEAIVRTKEEMAKCLSHGSHYRATESTDMNRQSSRSHAIFTITMEQKKVAHVVARVTNEDGGDDNLCAKLLLVDLAGSFQTGADGQRFEEGIHINEGLLALGKVINALGEEKRGYIPYRDSKLTRLLQDSLEGNSKIVMIACVSPADSNRMETLSTLTYAKDARNILNKAVVLQRKIEKASMSTKSCLECREKDKEIREKDKEIRDLKENVFTLEMEKAELIDSLNASKKMRMAMDGDLNHEGHKNDFCNQGYRSSSRSEDMDTSESEYFDDSDDDDWVLESEEKEKPVKKRICRTSVASNPLDMDCCSCSKNSSCKTTICPCRASGVSCRSSCACLTRKCANGKTDSKDFGGTGDYEVEEVRLFSGHASCLRKSDILQQSRFLQESMMSYYARPDNQLENSLWTYKYKPKKATEVCGNDESVKFLSDWLHMLHERDFQISKVQTDGDQCDMQDDDYRCSDSEDIDEELGLKNVLLVTGPVGCGKSAAIYACAQEQGFEILELSASDCRSGALVKQGFGEALESRWLKRSLGHPVESQNNHIVKSPQSLPNGRVSQEFENEVVEVIPLSDEEAPHDGIGASAKFFCKGNGTAHNQSEVKPLILFEDVDITFLEDRGFLAAIQQIAETAKRPMILTSNSNNPVLPDSLDRLQVCFTLPSLKICFAIYVWFVLQKEPMSNLIYWSD